MNWDNVWQTLAALTVTAILGFVGVWILKEKRVDGYYMSHGTGAQAVICVYAHWTWHTDEVAFCTDDVNKALDFTARANATIK